METFSIGHFMLSVCQKCQLIKSSFAACSTSAWWTRIATASGPPRRRWSSPAKARPTTSRSSSTSARFWTSAWHFRLTSCRSSGCSAGDSSARARVTSSKMGSTPTTATTRRHLRRRWSMPTRRRSTSFRTLSGFRSSSWSGYDCLDNHFSHLLQLILS